VKIEATALKQLVDEIAEQILKSRSGKPSATPAHAQAPIPQASSATRASTLSVTELAALIDHTNLKPEATRQDIEKLCREAKEYGFASVCVQPIWVSIAATELRGTSIGVGTVVGFPGGTVPTGVKCLEAELAIRKGATELDMVLPVGMLRQGAMDYVKQDIARVAELCKRYDLVLKVILEAAALREEEIAVGCVLAKLAGAGYVKTSTGVHPSGGATEEQVRLMRHVVGDDMGVKAAGGIRDAQTALAMVAAGASRIGTSAGPNILQELTDFTRR
jgi:deoxyribose-phosphate aldolase